MQRSLKFLVLAIVAGWAGGAHAADVEQIILYKGRQFLQTGTGTPTVGTNKPFRAGTFVSLSAANAVTNATLQLPSGTVTNLVLENGGLQWGLNEIEYSTQAALDAVFGSGNYTYTLKGQNDGTRAVTVTLTGDTYPVAPRISNFTAAQAVDPAGSFTLTWDALVNGSANDFVQMSISDANDQNEVYQSGQPGGPGALDGTSTSFQVPAGTLATGQTYTGRLLLYQAVDYDDTSYGFGVVSLAGYYSETRFTIVTTGQPDTNAPFLMNSQPNYGETNVPVHSGVAFTFGEPMQSSYSINWTGVNASNFSYLWSDDKMTLFCLYNTSLPLNTVIGWTLNPSSTNYQFRDLAGNNLPGDITGFFTTAPTNSTGVKDVEMIVVAKAQKFLQTNGTPVLADPDHGTPFQFQAEVNLTGSATVTNVAVQFPGAGTTNAPYNADNGDQFGLESGYADQTSLDSAFLNGTYTVTVKTVHDGTRTVALALTGNVYPPTPTVSNLAAAQAIVHSNSFTLTWSAFTGGTTNDYVSVSIENATGNYATLFETPDVGQPGALNGTHTSVVIPANTLYPGRTYEARLFFAKLTTRDTTSYPGVLALAGYLKDTQFTVQTAGTPLKPRLVMLPRNQGQIQMRLIGEPGFNYAIQATDDLKNPSWVQYWNQSTYDGATLDYTDFSSTFFTNRFYRAVEQPSFGD
ncbi:MAG: hypothetical protein HZA89_09885 [Verrucomicrobia bacterium]|nr:hypothetical protein [Verrucomicrobiota bacterium]